MIYTRYGDPVERIIWFDRSTQLASCAVIYDGKVENGRILNVRDLKADGGIHEIVAACDAAEQRGPNR